MKDFVAAALGIYLFTVGPVLANEEREELTCVDLTNIATPGPRPYGQLHFVLNEKENNWNWIVKQIYSGRNGSVVLLENPENEDESRELIWSNGWPCLFERYTKHD